MPKLTLSVDAEVVARAKRYARAQGTSVSGLVEKLLGLAAPDEQPPGHGADSGAPARFSQEGRPTRLPPISRAEVPMKRMLLDVNIVLGRSQAP